MTASEIVIKDAKMPRGRMGSERIDKELRQAASLKRLVVMEYENAEGEVKSHVVAPYSYRNGGQTFFGEDMQAKSIKAFKFVKIVRVQVSEKGYVPKWPIEIGDSI